MIRLLFGYFFWGGRLGLFEVYHLVSLHADSLNNISSHLNVAGDEELLELLVAEVAVDIFVDGREDLQVELLRVLPAGPVSTHLGFETACFGKLAQTYPSQRRVAPF